MKRCFAPVAEMSYNEFQVEKYVNQLQEYWDDNKPVFRLDSVSFFFIFGGVLLRGLSLQPFVCLLDCGLMTNCRLKFRCSGIMALFLLVDKKFIFAYPVACVILRYLIRPVMYAKLQMEIPLAKFYSNI